MRKLLRADGQERELHGPLSMRQIRELMGAVGLDTVMLADRVHVMLVDDLGHMKNLPINEEATKLYWEKCGRPVDHVIRGDAVVVPDEDFA
jgi:hypothetical protein